MNTYYIKMPCVYNGDFTPPDGKPEGWVKIDAYDFGDALVKYFLRRVFINKIIARAYRNLSNGKREIIFPDTVFRTKKNISHGVIDHGILYKSVIIEFDEILQGINHE